MATTERETAMSPAKRKTPEFTRGDALQMGRFLDEIEAGPSARSVALGALGNGFPQSTSDPAVVEHAAEVIAEQAQEGTSLVRIQRMQRALDLRAAAAALRETEEESEAMAWFRERGAAYCVHKGLTYEVLREWGVTAAVLKAAGVAR